MKAYEEAYKNLQAGGRMEHVSSFLIPQMSVCNRSLINSQVEGDIGFFCDDGTLPADAVLVSHGVAFLRRAHVQDVHLT